MQKPLSYLDQIKSQTEDAWGHASQQHDKAVPAKIRRGHSEIIITQVDSHGASNRQGNEAESPQQTDALWVDSHLMPPKEGDSFGGGESESKLSDWS